MAKRVREDLPLAARREALNCLWEEFECLRPLSHPNIIEAYGMWWVFCCCRRRLRTRRLEPTQPVAYRKMFRLFGE